MLTLELLRRFAPYAIGVALIAAALFGAYRHGVTTTDTRYRAILAQRDAEAAKRLASLQEQARRTEQDNAAFMSAVDQQHQKELRDEIVSRDRTIANLRAGSLQLRERFTCPSAGGERMPQAANATGQRAGGEAGGLRREDAEFLVRLASEADEVVHQLQACQTVVRVMGFP